MTVLAIGQLAVILNFSNVTSINQLTAICWKSHAFIVLVACFGSILRLGLLLGGDGDRLESGTVRSD